MDRRHFLVLPTLGPAALSAAAQTASPQTKRKKVAAIVTEYTWYSHADVICGRLMGGNSANGVWMPPRTHLVSLYRAQTPNREMTLDMAARNGFRVYPTIREALTLGGPKLAVDAVAFIAEQGQYPYNEVGQHLYPRFEMFSEILDVYEQSGFSVPTYFDKHYSYDWKKAKTLFDRSRRLKFPMLAGSSVPVTLRAPDVQPPLDTPMTEAACVGHGQVDAYGFHLLEAMQCIVERRKGGETGVREVEMIEGDSIWSWLDGPGEWAKSLLAAAHSLDPTRLPVSMREQAKNPVLMRVQYRDGFRAAALVLKPERINRTVAVRIAGRPEPLKTLFGPQAGRPLPHFDGLVRCIEELFVTGKEQYPPERTLITTGILAHAFESRRTKGPVSTPDMNVAYRTPADAWYQHA